MLCKNCGFDIPNEAAFCPHCGQKTETLINDSDKKRKKSMAILIGIILLVIIAVIAAVGIIMIMNRKTKADGLFHNIKWETSYEDVEEIINNNKEEKIIESEKESKELIITETIDFDFEISNLYIFDEEKLISVIMMINNAEDSSYSDREMADKYIKKLNGLYGKYAEDSIHYIWKTKKSSIRLINFQGMVMIEYLDLNNADKSILDKELLYTAKGALIFKS